MGGDPVIHQVETFFLNGAPHPVEEEARTLFVHEERRYPNRPRKMPRTGQRVGRGRGASHQLYHRPLPDRRIEMHIEDVRRASGGIFNSRDLYILFFVVCDDGMTWNRFRE